jgi:hypothetical protein
MDLEYFNGGMMDTSWTVLMFIVLVLMMVGLAKEDK